MSSLSDDVVVVVWIVEAPDDLQILDALGDALGVKARGAHGTGAATRQLRIRIGGETARAQLLSA
jgi:hypothetical protein